MTPQELLAAAEAGTLDMDSEEPQIKEPAPQQKDPAPTQAEQDPAHEGAEVVAPIASKSGAYTIPYEQLAKAREQAKAFAAEAEMLRAQLAELSATQAANLAAAQAQAQDRVDAGQEATQQDANLAAAQQAVAEGVDPAIFGDFSEEGIAKGVQTLVQQGVQRAIAPLLQERQVAAQQSATAAHYEAIYAAHPDADELAQSAEFAAWRESLPAFARGAVDQALTQGDAASVVDVFGAFKASANSSNPTPEGSRVRQALAAAKAQPHVPTSLSEIGGQAASSSTAEQVAALASNPDALLARMSDMTPAQLEKLMNSV